MLRKIDPMIAVTILLLIVAAFGLVCYEPVEAQRPRKFHEHPSIEFCGERAHRVVILDTVVTRWVYKNVDGVWVGQDTVRHHGADTACYRDGVRIN